MVLISCSRDNDNNTDIPLTPSQILALPHGKLQVQRMLPVAK
ncbi:hypothetical protein ACH34I_03075 [Elizabethkingia anophelis]